MNSDSLQALLSLPLLFVNQMKDEMAFGKCDTTEVFDLRRRLICVLVRACFRNLHLSCEDAREYGQSAFEMWSNALSREPGSTPAFIDGAIFYIQVLSLPHIPLAL